MTKERDERKAIRDGTVLNGVIFTDNERYSVFEPEYFSEGNTYLRDLKILGVHVKNEAGKQVSCGSSCLVYNGTLGDLDVIVKEFYPKTEDGFFYMERDDESQKLKIHVITQTENQEFADRKRKFLLGYHEQKEYIHRGNLREVITLPLGLGRYGDTYYIVNPVNQGMTMDGIQNWNGIEEKLRVLVHVADVLQILEKNRILFLDLSPENLLYVNVSDTVQQVKLFDVDSFIDLNRLDEVHELMYNPDYVWPKLENHLVYGNHFAHKKHTYLIPYAAVYSFGIIAFELLFGHRPSEKELQFDEEQMTLLQDTLAEQGLDALCCKELTEYLKAILCNDRCTAVWSYEKLNKLYQRLLSAQHQKQKSVDESNYLYFAYDMLQKYPLFEYADRIKDADKRCAGYNMEVAVIGSHPMRKYWLQALLACGQMLDSKLSIHLISSDAREFWNQYTSEKSNYELKKAVNVNTESEKESYDPALVDGELADVFLHELDDEKKMLPLLRAIKTRYILVFGENQGDNQRLLEELVKIRHGKKSVFVGYLGKKAEINNLSANWVMCPISWQQVVAGAHMKEEWKSCIYQMGLQIHYHYERMRKPRASIKEIERESYAGNHYNRISSERAALHMIYKLASVGITDLGDPNLIDHLYETVFSTSKKAQENFERLVWLEHKSWTAFMLCNGWSRLPSDEFDDFMYEGEHTWKDIEHRRHPHLVSSTPSRILRDYRLTDIEKHVKWDALDELDKISVKMFKTLQKKAIERKPILDICIRELDLLADQNLQAKMEHDFLWVKNAIDDCYALNPKTNARLNWEHAIKALTDCIKDMEMDSNAKRQRILSKLQELKKNMIPVLETVSRGDLKNSDEDIIRAIPLVLSQTKGFGTLSVVKPVCEKIWQNVFGTLSLRPDTLILVGNDLNDSDVEKYKDICREFGLENIRIKNEKAEVFKNKSIKGQLLFDMTGLSSYEGYVWMNSKVGKNGYFFDADQLRIRGWNNKNLGLLAFDVHLTVHETLELTGALDKTKKNKNDVGMISEHQVKAIWSSYSKVKKTYWRAFISWLSSNMKEKSYTPSMQPAKKAVAYVTEYVYRRLLEESGFEQILHKCSQMGWIKNLKIPYYYEQGGVVEFQSAYTSLATTLTSIARELAECVNPIQYRFCMDSASYNKCHIVNHSMYCNLVVPHKLIMVGTETKYFDDIVVSCLKELDSGNYHNLVFHNLQISDAEKDGGKRISFVFASDAVRSVMRNEGSILEVLIYYECLRKGVFDDIRINSIFHWGNSAIKNEIDVIGVKKNRSYFISVKMAEPEREFLDEIFQITQKFCLAGQPVLISSHTSTKQDNNNILAQRAGLMGVQYIGYNQLFAPDGTLIIADTIKRIVEEYNG